jgi:carboxymethylenebutenolidase
LEKIMSNVGLQVVEKDVEIKTPDGICDAAFIHPVHDSHPGVLIWCDAFGLRPVTRAIGRRVAAEGYSVLVPNPFYRVGKGISLDPSKMSFMNPYDMAKIRPLMASATAPGNAEKDAGDFVAFLDAQKEVDSSKKFGVQGYCMGGPLMMRTAAVFPHRIGAGASLHGNLVNDKPDSPHLLAPKIKARLYVGIAASDHARQPDAKDKLEGAFADAHVAAEVEIYPAKHGWCMEDMPIEDGVPVYNQVEAERAMEKVLELYGETLR